MESSKRDKIIRESLAISILGLALYLVYSIFFSNSNSTVGIMGVLVKSSIFFTFGIISYLIPFIFIIYSVILFKKDENIRAKEYFLSTFLFLLLTSSFLIIKDSLKNFIPNLPLFINEFKPSIILYLIPIIILLIFFVLIFFKKEKVNRIKLTFYSFILISSFAIMILNHSKISSSLDNVIIKILHIALNGKSGGALGGLIALPFLILFGSIGSLIILLSFSIALLMFFSNKIIKASFDTSLNILKKFFFNSKEKFVENDIEVNELKMDFYKNLKNDKKVNIEEKNLELLNNENKSFKMFKEESKPIEKIQSIEKLSNNKYTDKIDVKKDIVLKNNDRVDNILQKEAKLEVVNVLEESNTLDNIFLKDRNNLELKQKVIKLVEENVKKLEAVLDEHGIEAKVSDYKVGPTITRYEISVSKGTRVKQVLSLSDDIAMNLEAKSIRIEAPIPGKNAIGIEVPNMLREEVFFSSIIRNKKSSNLLDIVLGKNIVGEDVIVDLRNMPHLLIAGRTGSGKSVGVNCIISSIIYNASPKDVKFIMIDPKMVELMPYNGIPHLSIPVISDPKLASVALKWCVIEMENRYKILAKESVRNLESYNKQFPEAKIPYLVVVIDELADLMMTSAATVEESIARIAQKARAVGIHLVIATQRPSIDVITGTIKANLPSRIAFAVTSYVDSRTIIDVQGAERLLGKGDMLYLESGKPNLLRIQGAYISDKEVIDFTNYLKRKDKPTYNEEILKENVESDKDPLYERALDIIKEEKRASTTLIQRKLGIGYSRAARIMDQLEETGIIKIGKNGEKELLI